MADARDEAIGEAARHKRLGGLDYSSKSFLPRDILKCGVARRAAMVVQPWLDLGGAEMARWTAFVVVALLIPSAPAWSLSLYAVGPWSTELRSSNLYSIDISTGAATLVGPSGRDRIGGLAFSADGTLYGYDPLYLYTIDPATGGASTIGGLGFSHPEGGLSFQPGTDVLFGIASARGNDRLVSIDTSTGSSTVVASLGPEARDPSGLAFRADGTLFAVALRENLSDQLVTIDAVSGNVGVVGSLGVNVGTRSVAGAAFAGDTLYYTDGYSLYSLDQLTGAASLIGAHGSGGPMGGLAFIPEPGTGLLVGLGLLGLGLRANRRHPR